MTNSRICVFWCGAFLGALCSLSRGRQNTPENATPRNRSFREQVTADFRIVLAFSGVLVRPHPLNLGSDTSPPKFRGRPSKKNNCKTRDFGLRPLNLGGKSVAPKI